MRKIFTLFAVFFCALSVNARVIYLVPNEWASDNAAFFVHSWGGGSDIAGKMTQVSDNLYQYEIGGNTYCVFVRQNPALGDGIDWDKKWNRTADLVIPSDKNCYTITGWGDNDGTWSVQGNVTPPTPDSNATYYVTGTAELVGADKAWSETAIAMTKNAGVHTHTFANLAAGVVYKMKITNGTCASNWGFTAVQGAPNGVVGDGDDNVVFELSKACDVVVSFNGASITLKGDFTAEEPIKPGVATSVPSECGDVMLQAFYYDSYRDGAPGDVVISGTTKLGNTKWSTLLNQSGEIGTYFDLVWLPPSGRSEGGTGYHQTVYSNQNSAWGSQKDLLEFINRMHAANTKVVADIVINHAGNKSSWCDFHTQNFGEYGVFEPDASWIAKSDEVNSASDAGSCKGKATGPEDGGYNMQDNYGAARDWAHAKPEVQEMMKAYLKWMKNVIGFDGWRYDYAQGFKGKYINMYNSAAANYFSVVEFWNGDMNNIKNYLNDVNWNTLAFDFSTKYSAIQGIADGQYEKCKGSGLLGAGLSKYAVTFVDSHDTYFGCKNGRDNNDEIGGCGKSMEDYNKDRVLGANAFILSMPGVPCVFYPHWVKYKDAIGKMVLARKAAGVHSESKVSDEAGSGYYKATITGKNGSVRLLLGPNSGFATTPQGYTLAYKGGNFAMYYTTTHPETPVLNITPAATFKTESYTVEMSAVALSGTPTIYYTMDGSDPTTSATRKTYSGAFTVQGTVTVKACAVLNSVTSAVQEATYTYQEPQHTPLTVKFMPPTTWNKVYLYAWVKAGAVITPDWPGLEWKTKDSEGWLYHIYEEIKEVNIIFTNNEGEQSSDILLDQDACYEWKDGVEVLSDKCSKEINCTITTSVNNSNYGLTYGDTIVPWYTYITISAKANYGYHFSHWNDYNYDNPRQVQVTEDKTYTAYFDKNTYYITKKYDSNQGYINGSSSGEYLDNITLTAEANYGYHFVQWSDGNTENPRSLILTQDTTFIAEFALNQYTVTTLASHNERGTTEGDTVVNYLEYITISATANYGYHFVQWNDGNADNPRRVQVRRDETYTAYFEKDTYSVTTNYNSEQGYIDGVSSAKYLDIVTLTAMPKLGYEFVRWSDGNTANPRTFTLTQDTAFTAEFAQSFSGKCGDQLYWSYDLSNNSISISGRGKMYDYTADTQPWLLFQKNIIEVITSNKTLSIGKSAFEGCIRLAKLTLGSEVEEIGENAFAGCTRLYDIYSYPVYPPFAELSSFANYEVYLYIPCEGSRDYKLDLVWKRFMTIDCIGAETGEVEADSVKVEPSTNSVTITWPTDENADTYSIEIKRGDVVFCTLTFSKDGMLTNIAFAPSRSGSHPVTYAASTGKGLRFTVTSLDAATTYGYNVTTKDEEDNTLSTYTGEFTTKGGTTTDMDNIQSPVTTCQKLFRNGQLIILRNGKEYTTMGAEM